MTDSPLIFSRKKKGQVDPDESYNRPLTTNKWSQYQVDRWFRSVSTSHAKPKLRSQICGTFVPNLPSHQSAEKMANREAK